MASIAIIVNSKGGYDYIWINPPSKDLFCSVCERVARHPYQHGNGGCGSLFCGSCVREYDHCPSCQNTPFDSFQDNRATRAITKLRIKCNNMENGCQWQGELGDFELHEAECAYTFITCPNQCKDEREDRITRILRKDLQNHYDNECSKRQYECPHCKESGEYWERTTTHLDKCPDIEIQCPNVKCEINILRRELQDHRAVCAYELVPCRYAAVGCDEKPLRGNLNAHEGDYGAHLSLAFKTILDQQRQLSHVNTALKELERPANKPVFELTEFNRLKNNNQVFFSAAFYTARVGYKMCIQVYANGCGKGKNTHVSVAAHLMRGDFDYCLNWPFNKEVTFELLNQLEDSNHHKKAVLFLPDNECSQRVIEGECGSGVNEQEFIDHHDLCYRADLNCQYLKDDRLVFRVSTGENNHKAWLKCTI